MDYFLTLLEGASVDDNSQQGGTRDPSDSTLPFQPGVGKKQDQEQTEPETLHVESAQNSYEETRLDPLTTPRKSRQPTAALGQFGEYELLEEIARGGMGVVYLAKQKRLNRMVALKTILSGKLPPEDEFQRFINEAEAAAKLDHAGIVPVFDFGDHNGTHYLSMAYIPGPSLAERIKDRLPSPRESARIVSKTAEAIAYAHRQGVVHRDLKPANLLLDENNHPRITDFGLAKRIDEESDHDLTQEGVILGTVSYMSPEQAKGDSNQVGPAADIYALGAILYKLLTGNPPFQACSTMEILRQILGREPISPRKINPEVPRDLATICLKCLEKDPEKRFASAEELAQEIRRFELGKPIQSRPVGPFVLAYRWCNRNPMPAAFGMAFVAVVVTIIIATTTLFNRADEAKRRFQRQQNTVDNLSEVVLRKSLDETEDWLQLFFGPMEQDLAMTRGWIESEQLEPARAEQLNRLLLSLAQSNPSISKVIVADRMGNELLLSRPISNEGGTTPNENWRYRLTLREEDLATETWFELRGDSWIEIEGSVAGPDYDPRDRPWFRNAAQATLSDPNSTVGQWTRPYRFYMSNEIGITASVAENLPSREGVRIVVAFDILLEDLSRYATEKQPTPNGQICILTANGELIGFSNRLDEADFKTPSELELSPLKSLKSQPLKSAAQEFSLRFEAGEQVQQFLVEGEHWWGAVRPIHFGSNLKLWILVLVPEADLFERLEAP